MVFVFGCRRGLCGGFAVWVWLVALACRFGLSFWLVALSCCAGLLRWHVALACRFGLLCWLVALACCAGLLRWLVVLACRSVLSRWHAIHGGFRCHSMALRATFQRRKVAKSLFRNLLALRVPAAFFEIILRKVAQNALPVRCAQFAIHGELTCLRLTSKNKSDARVGQSQLRKNLKTLA